MDRIVRIKPNPKPMLNLEIVRDLQAKDNLAYDASTQTKPTDPWASWFKGEKEKPSVLAPKVLTAAEVGPDAT